MIEKWIKIDFSEDFKFPQEFSAECDSACYECPMFYHDDFYGYDYCIAIAFAKIKGNNLCPFCKGNGTEINNVQDTYRR